MTLANWVREQTGVDPAPELRGHYRTELGWRRIAKREGGLPHLIGRLATAAGLSPVTEYQPGDIAVIGVPTIGEACAIRSERRWVMKFQGGLLGADLKPLVAWGLR